MNHSLNPALALGCNLLLAIFAAGCSSPVSVHYTPVAAVQPLIEDEAKAPHVYVMRFADHHDGGNSVGGNRNVYGMKVIDAKTQDDIPGIMTEALTDTLRKAGLKATLHPEHQLGDPLPADEAGKYQYVISGEIQQFNAESHPGWVTIDVNAKVTIRLLVSHEGKEIWVGPITGTASDAGLALGQSLDIAMQNCMRNAIQQLADSKIIQPIP